MVLFPSPEVIYLASYQKYRTDGNRESHQTGKCKCAWLINSESGGSDPSFLLCSCFKSHSAESVPDGKTRCLLCGELILNSRSLLTQNHVSHVFGVHGVCSKSVPLGSCRGFSITPEDDFSRFGEGLSRASCQHFLSIVPPPSANCNSQNRGRGSAAHWAPLMPDSKIRFLSSDVPETVPSSPLETFSNSCYP